MEIPRFCYISMLIFMSYYVVRTCISMAIEDFYSNRNHTTMIVPHFRDSGTDAVAAASAAIELLKNTQVMAILGPQRSVQADFVIDIGDKVRVPVISPSTSPTLSSKESQYFIRSAWCSSSQAKAIAAIVKAFGWKEVTLVYEDNNYGTSSTTTRVFVVVMLPNLASRFFQMAEEVGMVAEGYAWIISDVLTSLLDSVDSETIEAMQGILGVRPYIPRSPELSRFTKRWRRRFHEENPEMDRTELNVFGLWAYDSTTALADAVERVGVASPRFKKPMQRWNLTDLEAIGISISDPSLVHLIRNYKSKWGQLQPSVFEIVNVVGAGANRVGFWTERYGISQKLQVDDPKAVYSTKKDDLGGVVWPGRGVLVPKGWEVSTNGTKLKVGVTNKSGFPEFTRVERDSETNAVEATGFCIDVFKQVMESLPYGVPYEFIPMDFLDHVSTGDYSDITIPTSNVVCDAFAGDVTITANRSDLVDFTIPYTESGVAGAFFFFTGFVVWALEHRTNEEFQGPPLQQVGTIFWFSLSTIFSAQRERIISNLTRFVVIVWMFVVLVLTSSYTASLTTMLTVQQLQPTITDVRDLIEAGEYVGYQYGSC
ncbi:glutamate receptor 2.7-like [Salvia divinorum]|uniref:Glutamate receptor 2.7-like n=1 Tax=Salvia divinorum TaxID=28513 RepID=A0ABD1G5S4_SALDI